LNFYLFPTLAMTADGFAGEIVNPTAYGVLVCTPQNISLEKLQKGRRVGDKPTSNTKIEN
jgi:hypothetical protein